jgi:phosphoglycerate dehydrogenase-like enzyme
VTRRLVIDLRSPRAAWRIPDWGVAAIRETAGPGWDVVDVAGPTDSDGDGGVGTPASVAAAAGAEVYLGYGVPEGVARAARATLRWAHSGTAGVGASIARLRGAAAVLTNSAGVHAEPMADWVLAAVAHFARGLDRMIEAQREGRWAKAEATELRWTMRELRDLRVGVVGLGGVGSAVARRALALGMRVAGVRRRPERGGPPGVAWVGGPDAVPRLAAESDCFVLAAPHTTGTAGLVDAALLARLPAQAVLVNVARGSLVDESALLAALDAGALRGAALDVFAAEPLPPDHPFWRHPRVLVSPHACAVTERFWERETALILDNLRRYLLGEPLRNVVDLDAGY